MTLGLLGLLLACGEKEANEDTGVDTVEPSSENTDTAEVEDSDTDTEETDTSDTLDTEEPEYTTDFPELLPEFMDRFAEASPMPLESDTLDNTTVMGLLTFNFMPIMQVQEMMSAAEQSGTVMTCPEVQGTFPEEGLPTEDVIVTGNGCVDDFGTEYNGSFVYNADGIRYSEFEMVMAHPTCTGLSNVVGFNGGFDMNMGVSDINIESLLIFSSVEIGDADCSENINEIQYHMNARVEMGANDSQTIHGHADVLFPVSSTDYFFTIDTIEQVMDSTVCETEPISGENVMSNGSDEARFTFDGATDCDEEPTQMLSFNGESPVEVNGVSCSTASAPGMMMWISGLLGLLFVRRRQ